MFRRADRRFSRDGTETTADGLLAQTLDLFVSLACRALDLMPSRLVPCRLITCHPIPPHIIPAHVMPSCLIPPRPMSSEFIPSHPISCTVLLSHPIILSRTILCRLVCPHPAPRFSLSPRLDTPLPTPLSHTATLFQSLCQTHELPHDSACPTPRTAT